ncbi:MAG: sugar phosphate nucleotidyltransferase [Pseudomonadota bacterium]
MALPVVILAGGLATRMRPLTLSTPKALLSVAGRPFIEWQLLDLAKQGIQKVVLCTGYLSEQLENALGSGNQFGLNITYVPDGKTLLGTGGCVKNALPHLGEHFFVLYGDSFLRCPLDKIEASFFKHKKLALMTVLKNGNQWDKSNVRYHDNRVILYDKHNPSSDMAYIDYGLGLLSASSLNNYPENTSFDLAELYHQLSLDNQLTGYEVFERFYEIGSFQGLKETEAYFSSQG